MTTATIAILSFLLGWFAATIFIRRSMAYYLKKNPTLAQFVGKYLRAHE